MSEHKAGTTAAPRRNAVFEPGERLAAPATSPCPRRDTLQDATIVLDPDGRIRSWNEAAARLYGCPAEEAVGRRIVDVLQTEFPDGERDVERHARAAQIALRESEERLRLALDATSEVVWDWDLVTGRIWQGHRWAEMLGYAPELTPETMDALRPFVHPEDLPAMQREVSRAVEGATDAVEFEHRLRSVSGEWRWMLARARVVERDAAGKGVRVVGTCADIDAQKHATQALLDADRRKEQFLAMLSHELRNPLSAARNGLFVLDRAAPGSAQARTSHEILERQLEQLTQLVEDLLDVSRITTGKIQIHRTRLDLVVLARRCADDCRAAFVARGLELRVELPPEPLWVECDGTRMAQVLGNLLQNAAKFTSRGHVLLALDAEPGGGRARVRVRDTGVGIEPGLRSRLFRPFEQADSTLDRSQGGLGLGLALVKGLVDLHGGTVAVQSDGPGHGTEFVVRLPLGRGPASAVAERECPGAGASLHIVAVEDEEDAAIVLGEMLTFLGHRADVARSGPEALALVRRVRPDLVLCDIGLPGMSGYDVARALREDPDLRGTALIALSGYASPADVQRAVDAGFDRHLAKPIAPEDLSRVLASVGRDLPSPGREAGAGRREARAPDGDLRAPPRVAAGKRGR